MRFSEMLTIATLVTGGIWALDALYFRRFRMRASSSIGYERVANEPKLVEWARTFFPILLLVFVLRTFLAEPFQIPSGSMKPTLLEGDFILVNKFNYGLRLPLLNIKIYPVDAPKRGDIVVFKRRQGKDLIKRVVGLPGDRISYKDKILYINGEPAKQEFQAHAIDVDTKGMIWHVAEKIEDIGSLKHHIFVQNTPDTFARYYYAETVVPEHSYYVMGDNRDNSEDSRYFGVIPDKDLIGRAFAIWMSWDSKERSIRWNRLGKLS